MTEENKTNNGITEHEETVHVDRITSVRLPQLWRNKPNLWFLQAKGLMRREKITKDNLKLEELVCNLEPDVLTIIEDILECSDEEKSYKRAKERILWIFSDSEESKVRTLLQSLTLDDNKPSELLRRMRSLAGGGDFRRISEKHVGAEATNSYATNPQSEPWHVIKHG